MGISASERNPSSLLYSLLCPKQRKRSKIRVRHLTRRSRRRLERRDVMVVVRTKMELKNLKLYLENRSIIEENGKLRKKAQLLHQENQALMHQLHNKYSNLEEDFSTLGFVGSS